MSGGFSLIATGIRYSLRWSRRVWPAIQAIIPASSGKPSLGQTAGLKRFTALSSKTRKNRSRGGILLVETGVAHRQSAKTDLGYVCRGGVVHNHSKFPLLRGFY